MSNFYISKPQPVVIQQVQSAFEIGLSAVVNFNSTGLVYDNGIINNSLYNVASQSFPRPVAVSGLYVKYGAAPGNMYAGGTLNRFVVSFLKNDVVQFAFSVDNAASSLGPVQKFGGGYVAMVPSDTWAIRVEPSGVAGQAPTTGQNTWFFTVTLA
jgi:hypothetical protein